MKKAPAPRYLPDQPTLDNLAEAVMHLEKAHSRPAPARPAHAPVPAQLPLFHVVPSVPVLARSGLPPLTERVQTEAAAFFAHARWSRHPPTSAAPVAPDLASAPGLPLLATGVVVVHFSSPTLAECVFLVTLPTFLTTTKLLPMLPRDLQERLKALSAAVECSEPEPTRQSVATLAAVAVECFELYNFWTDFARRTGCPLPPDGGFHNASTAMWTLAKVVLGNQARDALARGTGGLVEAMPGARVPIAGVVRL